jgi:hypothetical protein
MHINNWQIFDKSGSGLTLHSDSYVNLNFTSPLGKDATGFLISDPDGIISEAEITNSGYGYDASTEVSYSYAFDTLYPSVIRLYCFAPKFCPTKLASATWNPDAIIQAKLSICEPTR